MLGGRACTDATARHTAAPAQPKRRSAHQGLVAAGDACATSRLSSSLKPTDLPACSASCQLLARCVAGEGRGGEHAGMSAGASIPVRGQWPISCHSLVPLPCDPHLLPT